MQTLRPFQEAVVARARDTNVVMVGATGIGKTFVAIALLSEQDYGGGKRAFVLAPTRQLVWQIHAKISATTTLRAGAYCGLEMESWGAHEWTRELLMTRVFVCTPEVLRTALERGFVQMRLINLLVFDECHHVTKRHPYAHVIKMYDKTKTADMPRVFGTTATPTRDCAKNLHAEIFKVELEEQETVEYAAAAPIKLENYDKEEKGEPVMTQLAQVAQRISESDGLHDQAIENELRAMGLTELIEILQDLKATSVLCKLLGKGNGVGTRDNTRVDKLVRKFVLACVEIFRNLGRWCVYRFIELEIERSAVNATLLLHVPGSMFGFDPAATTLLLNARGKRHECNFAASKRLKKVTDLLAERLGVGESVSSESDDETGVDLDSLATTECLDMVSLAPTEEFSPTAEAPRMLQGIVFVTTRAECRVVCEYLNEKFPDVGDGDENTSADEADEEEEVETASDGGDELEKDPRFACILGQASSRDTASYGLPKMEEILTKFEQGLIPFLVSTAVSIEGVDFPQCSLIIVASRIQTARKLIQLRGRARHEDGVVYYLCETGDHEHAVHFKAMEEEAKAIDALDFRHDKEESVLRLPRSQAAAKLVGFKYFPEEARIEVGSTGAVLDLDSSIARLNMFCQTLPKQLGAIDMKTMYTFEQTSIQKRPLFRAKLTLPPGLDLSKTEFASELMHSKATAKAAVAFAACKYLFDQGLLDDSLNSVYRKPKANDLSNVFHKLHL